MSDCGLWTSRLVDNARAGTPPSPGLLEHMSSCPSCGAHWRNQRVLTRELQILSDRVATRRPPQAVREALLREFDHRQRVKRWNWLRWVPIPAAAALAVVALVEAPHRSAVKPVQPAVGMAALSADTSDEGFVEVPYAPPLAPGEFVSVVRQELEPAALIRMGLPTNGLGDAPVMADVVMGEDGFPRAVRVADETANELE
ncbi:MAG: hypothetical protein ABSB67_14565 [Bryobacteraceae bacterium]|jgi:hypothetical protein